MKPSCPEICAIILSLAMIVTFKGNASRLDHAIEPTLRKQLLNVAIALGCSAGRDKRRAESRAARNGAGDTRSENMLTAHDRLAAMDRFTLTTLWRSAPSRSPQCGLARNQTFSEVP